MNTDAIERLERIGIKAWHALETIQYDGWLLHFSKGYTGRANSINPLGESTLPIAEKIAHCEQLYAARGLPARFRLSAACQPPDMDSILEQRGYQRGARKTGMTVFQVANIGTHQIDSAFQHRETPSDAWFNAYAQMNNIAPQHHPTLKAMLQQNPCRLCCVQIEDKAVGLGILTEGHLGLFGLVVHPDHRRQGLGKCLIESLMAWGRDQRATTAYLQVLDTNQPALNLYQQLGFRTHHRYWYRNQPTS